jgi:hypothetical protein
MGEEASLLLKDADTCDFSYPRYFTQSLDGIECFGMSMVSTANTSDQCAAACCKSPQGFEHCEAWQWCEKCIPANTRCWIGKCASSIPSTVWTGRARPTPNQGTVY